MFEWWILRFLFVLLCSESILIPLVGVRIARVAVVLPLALCAFRAAIVKPALSPDVRHSIRVLSQGAFARPIHAFVFLGFVTCFLGSLARAAQLGTLEVTDSLSEVILWSSVIALLVTVALPGDNGELPAPVLRGMTLAFLWYTVVNVLLFTVGVQNEYINAWYVSAPEHGVMFRLLGLDVMRAPLVLGNGADPSGTQVAPGFVIGLALGRMGGNGATRRRGLMLAGASMICLLITDSRGGLMGVAAGVGIMLLPGMLRRHARWLALALPVLPLLLMAIIRSFANSPFLRTLQRAGESNVGALSGRPLIWGSILTFFSRFDPQQIIGYGARGQIGSGEIGRASCRERV